MHADPFDPLYAVIGYGHLGRDGDLGYEDKRVVVGGVERRDALSTHPPARVVYALGGRADAFRCEVAIDDQAIDEGGTGWFEVLADGRTVARVDGVTAGEPPQPLRADLRGAHALELRAGSDTYYYAYAVWLAPAIEAATGPPPAAIADPLGCAEMRLPDPPLEEAGTCVATVASAGFEWLLDDMLGSLVANGGLPDARRIVFVLGDAPDCERIAAAHGATTVACRPLSRVTVAAGALLYSVAYAAPARHYLCLDADMLVLDDLSPVVAATSALPEHHVLAAREGNGPYFRDVEHVLGQVYDAPVSDLPELLGTGDPGPVARYPFVVNSGVFAGTRRALLGLDATVRSMPGARAWLQAAPHIPWREQAIFNLALAHARTGAELDPRFNVQLHATSVHVGGDLAVRWERRPVAILHFNGAARHAHPELRGRHAAVPAHA